MRLYSFSYFCKILQEKKQTHGLRLCHSQISSLPCKHKWQQRYSSTKCISCSCSHNLLLSYIEQLGHEKPEVTCCPQDSSPSTRQKGRATGKRNHFMLIWKHKIHMKQPRREPGCSSRAWFKCYILRRLASVLQSAEAQLKFPKCCWFSSEHQVIVQVLSATCASLTWLQEVLV